MLHLLGLLCFGLPVLVVSVAIQALVLRLIASGFFAVRIGFPHAMAAVFIANVVQGTTSAVFFGADVGLCGSLVVFFVWAGMLSMLTELSMGQAAITGILMSVLGWLVMAGVVMLFVALGITAIAALAL